MNNRTFLRKDLTRPDDGGRLEPESGGRKLEVDEDQLLQLHFLQLDLALDLLGGLLRHRVLVRRGRRFVVRSPRDRL